MAQRILLLLLWCVVAFHITDEASWLKAGRGNVPFFGAHTFALCTSIGAIASDVGFVVYARQKTPLKIKLNTIALALLAIATVLNISAWINASIIFLRTRRWAYEDEEPDWLQPDPAPSVGTSAVEEHELEQSKPLPPPPPRLPNTVQFTPHPQSFYSPPESSDPLAASDDSAYVEQFLRRESATMARRPLNATMYTPGPTRQNFKAPPVYQASSRYSTSTFHPSKIGA